MNRIAFLFLYLVLVTASCDKKSSGTGGGGGTSPVTTTFSNPILSSGPDPWIIQKDNSYYYTHTLGNRIMIWKTDKVSNMRNAASRTVWTAPSTGPNSQNVWAPELHYLNSKWYLYYTAGSSSDLATQRTFVLENANADPTTGVWTDKGRLFDPAADFFAIDGTILSNNGNLYFIWSGQLSNADNTQRIFIASMSDPWTLSSGRVQISAPTLSWEINGAPPGVNEGPETLRNAAGRLFLIYSASGCWTDEYELGMLTLNSGGDPLNAADWVKNNTPVFTKNASGGVFGPGHNSFFKSADGTQDWILYHANSGAGQGCGDLRSPRIQQFTWNTDGTPNFGIPVATGAQIPKPSGE